ncbi:MAG TPA: zinc ribbon domain-containing protein [Candidatus Nitrosopolaris sp.]|nr:zinc ribbon domain-containing protein [Candidatus Nitrosopolaris sp.]
MSVGANDESLRVIAEKLKQFTNDSQEQYEAFIDATQLYNKGDVNQRDFLSKLADYLIGMTSLNFVAIQVLFEIKLALQTNLSKVQSSVPHPSQMDQNMKKVGVVDVRNTAGAVTDSIQMKPAGSQTKAAKVKDCIVCGATISNQAKFCNKCGNSQ